MATNKIRVSDFAADLNLPAQEIIDKLRTLDEKLKKPTSALTDAEMNYLLECYTHEHQVKDFNAYFADRSESAQPQQTAKKPTRAAKPEAADGLYRRVIEAWRAAGLPVETGRFRTEMRVSLVNDGPVTILLDSEKAF